MPAPSGPTSEPALSAIPDTTFAAVRSSGEPTTSGVNAECSGRDSATSVAVTVARP